jgi:hypothetical protein
MLSFDSSSGNLNVAIQRMATTGVFGGSSWRKLYDAP